VMSKGEFDTVEWTLLYGHTSPSEFAMANTDVLADVDYDSGTG
jgi:hypothetical protein